MYYLRVLSTFICITYTASNVEKNTIQTKPSEDGFAFVSYSGLTVMQHSGLFPYITRQRYIRRQYTAMTVQTLPPAHGSTLLPELRTLRPPGSHL